jgi:gas vesicle protein
MAYTIFAQLRRVAKSMRKGGSAMSEIREKMVTTMEGVLSGATPLDTAEVVQDLGYTAVMDKFADDREAKRVGDKELTKQVDEAQKKIKKM